MRPKERPRPRSHHALPAAGGCPHAPRPPTAVQGVLPLSRYGVRRLLGGRGGRESPPWWPPCTPLPVARACTLAAPASTLGLALSGGVWGNVSATPVEDLLHGRPAARTGLAHTPAGGGQDAGHRVAESRRKAPAGGPSEDVALLDLRAGTASPERLPPWEPLCYRSSA